MKLLTKLNRSYIKYGFLIFLVADLIIIHVSNRILISEIDQELELEAMEITKSIENEGSFQNLYPTAMVQEIQAATNSSTIIKDTTLFDAFQDEFAPFREYSTTKLINGKRFRITTRHMLMEFNDLITLFTTLFSVVFLLIFIGFLIFTQKLNIHIWAEFNENIKKLKDYSFQSNVPLRLNKTQIDEFDDLNNVLIKMSDRLGKDYQASKEFSTNAAHEIQTPLAIIRNKCEALFSKEDLKEDTIDAIREIYLSTDRLSGITKGLLLLAKIDHGQFNDAEKIQLEKIISDKLEFFQELIDDKKLSIIWNSEEKCSLFMDKRLALLWIQNMIINAIKYSQEGGEINIKITKDQLSISNYGEECIHHPEQIFNRFYSESNGKHSTGIGLAIVKKIADHYHMDINYSFKDFKHTFTFKLPTC